MLKSLAENTKVTNYETGTTETEIKLPDGCECGEKIVLKLVGDPAVPIIGKRAAAVMLDNSGHGIYIGMIEG
jgi:hypothetical protein